MIVGWILVALVTGVLSAPKGKSLPDVRNVFGSGDLTMRRPWHVIDGS